MPNLPAPRGSAESIIHYANVMLADLFSARPLTPPTPAHWPRLIQTATAEAILPALWSRLQTLNLTDTVPSSFAQVLQTAESLNRERNDHVLNESIQVAALLNTIGIQPVALKGLAYILTGAYSDPATRHLQDIDLLIPETQLPQALALLEKRGFSPGDPDALSAFRHHAPPIQRPFAPPIELHHSIGSALCRRILPATEIFREAKSVTIAGSQFLLPNPNHLVIHLILHSQFMNPYFETVFPPLRSLYDLQQLSQNLPIAWPAIVNRFQAHRQYLALALYIKEAERVLALPPPFPLKLSRFGQLAWSHRSLLTRHPYLRFADPIYLFSALVGRRFRTVREVVNHPDGFRSLFRALLTGHYYRNLLRI